MPANPIDNNLIGEKMNPNLTQNSDEPAAEIDFSQGERGKFYRPHLKLNLPVYFDDDIQQFLADIATRKGVAITEVANELLRKDMALLDVMR